MAYHFFSTAAEFVKNNPSLNRGKLLCEEYRKELMKIVQHYTRDTFRRHRHDYDLSGLVYEFAIAIQERECEYGILCVLVVTNMIQLLLRIYDITQLEIKFSTHKMRVTQTLIATVLSPTQLHTYATCLEDADPSSITKWKEMQRELHEDPPPKLITKRFWKQMYHHRKHASAHHIDCGKHMVCNHPFICSWKVMRERTTSRFVGTVSEEVLDLWKREE